MVSPSGRLGYSGMRRSVALITALVASALLIGIAGTAAPASALPAGDGGPEPPGLAGRETHMTLLTTHESDCTELAIVRAVTPEGARALVPERYTPLTLASGGLPIGRFAMWDYVCEHFSVDGQSHAPRTQISIGAVAISTRDDDPVSFAFYLVYLSTDNPVLAARYRQVGLPASFERGLSATVSDLSASPFEVSFDVPDPRYNIMGVGAMAPMPVPVASDGPDVYYDGGSGEVLLSYRNTMGAAVAGQVTGDYREHEILAPIIFLPRLLQPAGAPFAIARGDWDGTVARLD